MSDDRLDIEESFHEQFRKDSRIERKMLSKTDRSKFKKSDTDKKAKIKEGEGLRGRVLALTREGMLVETPSKNYICALRGSLKKELTHQKNLVTVGDFVRIEPIEDNKAMIFHVEPRRSVLSRADNLRRRKEHLIAANVDQVLIVASVMMPRLKPFLIDRYLIAADKGNMQGVIILNKIDLLKRPPKELDPALIQEQKEIYHEFIEAYTKLSIPVIQISATTGKGMDDLREIMKGKASVFSGQSGVGKTSLINTVTGLDLPVGDLAGRTLKGTHTTSTPQLVPIGPETYCIDTPGIKSFGLWDCSPQELQGYYEEFLPFIAACKFPGCTHHQEPGCAVKHAHAEGAISTLRYESYITLLLNNAD